LNVYFFQPEKKTLTRLLGHTRDTFWLLLSLYACARWRSSMSKKLHSHDEHCLCCACLLWSKKLSRRWQNARRIWANMQWRRRTRRSPACLTTPILVVLRQRV